MDLKDVYKRQVYGTLEESEDEDPAVFIRSLKINDSEYEINDYLL